MYNKQELINSLTEYLAVVLNISTSSNFIILDMQDDLESIEDLMGFRVFVKEAIAKQDKEFDYKTGYQKFLILVEKFKSKSLVITDKEFDQINLWCDLLFKKVTWYFDELAWQYPTEDQLKRQQWKNYQYKGKDMISKKEEMVIDKIGDTVAIYKLATKNKPLFQKLIEQTTRNLVVSKKKQNLLIGANSNKLIGN